MADEWWSASQRSHGASACSAAEPPLTDRDTCGWTSPAAAAAAESTSSITFQDASRSSATHRQSLCDADAASSHGDPHMDWTQAFLSGRSDSSFRAVLQDDMAASTRPFRAQPTGVDETTVMNNPFRGMSMGHGLLLDQASSLESSAYGTAALQGLSSFDGTAAEPVAAAVHNITTFADYLSSESYDAAAAMQLSQTPSRPSFPSAAQMQFWSGSYQLPFGGAPLPSQLLLQAMQPKTSCSSNANTLMAKSNSGSALQAQHACSSAGRKTVLDSQAAAKRPRIEAPSPLPTFKVRKEKLGDRITALQQLVSPFGKTDTASVLHEAIEYIKFLHEQVASLSSPYLKNGNPLQHFQQKGSDQSTKDTGEAKPAALRSRGLCLVPVASTYTVASETVPEFWHPTFGGTFR
ncbi:hypothetical protein GUJ93_ZPchr0001g32167 [Zizania palustris]|uniref:BHLH domain-containing protein n=1 Tax=Zizania palustris TaxID=103762 RepID=A0A8J5VPI5_ZIZPA|nr:hypothetical protein GUJ93_ZPchr0001g32167 [Zizania palustris]